MTKRYAVLNDEVRREYSTLQAAKIAAFYLADRSGLTVDVVDLKTGKTVGRVTYRTEWKLKGGR